MWGRGVAPRSCQSRAALLRRTAVSLGGALAAHPVLLQLFQVQHSSVVGFLPAISDASKLAAADATYSWLLGSVGIQAHGRARQVRWRLQEASGKRLASPT